MQQGSKILMIGPIDQIQPGTFTPLAESVGVEVTHLACDSMPTVNRNYIGTVFSYEVNLKDLVASLNSMESHSDKV